ncbi:serine-rich adhesin for platelets isoform X6 [Drosophila tropicalis]|uniref:serine-rich adhesin for platelets isoform X6 n=1 Tax=Drosophila tropicalis TaxID=46794 RepID=UPI0035ABC8D8
MANHNDSIGSGSPEVASSPAGDQQPQPLNQLNSSVDSGIAVGLDVDSPSLKLQQRLQQCQRILQVLRRDEAAYQLLRDRLSKISNKKTKKKDDSDVVEESPSTCNVCCGDLDISNAKNYVKCRTCEKSVCRGLKCADWHPKDGQWECQLCHNSKESLAHTSSWVAEQMSFNQHKFVYPMRARSEVYIPIQPSQDGQDVESTIQFESVSQIGIRNHMNIEERAKIREYVEEIVAEMLGGNLDKIKVGQLSKSENYLQLFDKYHAKLSNLLINVENGLCVRQLSRRGGDLPAIVNGHSNNNNNSNSNNNNNGSTCNINGNNEQNDDSSQTRLRTLIETIIAETLRNSALGFNTGASASVSEISLDTRTQSELNALKQRHRTEHYFEPKIYQDLLATAVLNKIADTEGNNRRRSLISESTPDLSGHNNIDENYNAEALSTTSGSSIEPRSDCSLTDNELVLNTGKTDSPLSLQAALERESVLSDYIAAHMVPLPDFSASVTESEDDNGSVTSSMIADGTWEDNWLFKKKQHSSLQSSATPSSIGMLVPAPRENVRAQIGDRTADEVSDLSEMGSDVEETSLDINDRLLNKHLIGGQNTKLVLDELIDRTSLISHTLPEEHEPAYTEATNPLLLQTQPTDVPTQFIEPPPPMTFQDDQHIEEPILIADQISTDSNRSDESAPSTAYETFHGDDTEQEWVELNAETEDERRCINLISHNEITLTNRTNTTSTTSTIRRTNGKLTNGSLRWSNKLESQTQSESVHNQHHHNVQNENIKDKDHVVDQNDDDDVVLLRRFVPGSIAEREVKKWYNAVEMPNNPYAPEALKQRISGTQERCMDVPNISPSAEQKALALMANAEDAADRQPQSPQTDYKRYSRDYYINNNNGTTMATNEKIDVARSGQEDVDIVINEAQNASKTAAEHQQDMEEQQLQDRQKATVYKALPAQILEDANSPSPSPSVETQSNPSLATTTTSEDSDTVRIYDFNKQETTVIKQQSTVEQTVETVESSTYSTSSSYSIDSSVVAKKRERPVVLQFGPGDSAPTIGSPMGTPTRGSTPPAFRFLQPKRRLIEPSQVLSIDQDDQDDNVREPSTPLADKPAVEDDVVHALPSVKALAQAFLLTSKHTQPQRRWRARHVRVAASASAPETPDKPAVSPSSNLSRKHRLEHAVSMAEVADESTIASDLSSLETDSSIPSEGGNAFVPPTASPVPVRRGFLRSNIAFFENLKFK